MSPISIFFYLLLSAFLYQLAFFLPEYLGFLVLFFWIPLFFVFKKINSSSMAFRAGFVWGILSYIPHCFWLLILLLTKSEATWLLATAIYTFVIFYFSLSAGIWGIVYYKVSKSFKVGRALFFLITMYGYFYFLDKYGLWIVSYENIKKGIGGYPFFSPLIPLASFKLFLRGFSLVYFLIFGVDCRVNKLPMAYKIFHLQPDENFYRNSPEVAGQRIYHKLAALDLNNIKYKETKLIVVAPESTFPFDLNAPSEIIDLWSCVLPKNSHLLIGGVSSKREEKRVKWFQSIYEVNAGRIINSYDKNHLIPFVENQPKFWKKFNFSSQLFLLNKRELSKGCGSIDFQISDQFHISPKICSEIFFLPLERLNGKNCIFAFINDSWFISSFRFWMKNYLKLLSIRLGRPILYIGFNDCFFV